MVANKQHNQPEFTITDSIKVNDREVKVGHFNQSLVPDLQPGSFVWELPPMILVSDSLSPAEQDRAISRELQNF